MGLSVGYVCVLGCWLAVLCVGSYSTGSCPFLHSQLPLFALPNRIAHAPAPDAVELLAGCIVRKQLLYGQLPIFTFSPRTRHHLQIRCRQRLLPTPWSCRLAMFCVSDCWLAILCVGSYSTSSCPFLHSQLPLIALPNRIAHVLASNIFYEYMA